MKKYKTKLYTKKNTNIQKYEIFESTLKHAMF